MAISSFSQDTIIEYTPESERGSDNPCVIKTKFVSFARVQHYANIIERKVGEDIRGIKDVNKRVELKTRVAREVQRQQFVENVVGVENYSVDGKSITTAAELYDAADNDLITEIIMAMESSSRLTEGQRKNSAGASATS